MIPQMTFADQLNQAVDQNNSLACVGLDSELEKLPAHLKNRKNAQFEFNKAIIDATADSVCAYKPNSAFYEATGADGLRQLKLTCDYLNKNYPSIPIILDAKRADIGNTNNGYVSFAYDYLGVDAITLHPYLGSEALEPFLARKDKGAIILCHTTNPGAAEFQELEIGGQPFYERVAGTVAYGWNKNGNCSLVAGAVYPEEMKTIRGIVGQEMMLLVPGIGAQGGDLEAVMKAGIGANQRGLIINSSRGIIFASGGKDFAVQARKETLKLKEAINKYR